MPHTEVDDAVHRVAAASDNLRAVWEGESHATDEGRERIATAIEECNSATAVLAAAWNARGDDVPRPVLSPVDQAASSTDSGALPDQEIGGPTD
jgi:uncharacterized protein YukE